MREKKDRRRSRKGWGTPVRSMIKKKKKKKKKLNKRIII